jgi:hypothetical protein
MSRPRTRRRTIARFAGIAALVGALQAPLAAPAQTPQPVANPQDQLGLSIVGGLALPGTIDSSPGGSVDTKVGFVVRAAGDAMIVPKLSLGAYALLGSTSSDPGGIGATIWGFGATIKGHFRVQSVQLRAGLAVAFQLESADVPGSETSKGFGIAPVLEAAIPIASTLNLLVHASFISQPAGGNSQADVTWAPIVYFAAGLEFVK